jgi:YggT family protein
MVFLLLGYLLTALQIAIIARALFSWIDPVGRTPVGAFLHTITNPILNPIRRVMPSTGFIDLSPIIALVLITVVRQLLGV